MGGSPYKVTSSGVIRIADDQSWEDITLSGNTQWGAFLRAGLKAGHFLISIEYNAVRSSITTLASTRVKSGKYRLH